MNPLPYQDIDDDACMNSGNHGLMTSSATFWLLAFGFCLSALECCGVNDGYYFSVYYLLV